MVIREISLHCEREVNVMFAKLFREAALWSGLMVLAGALGGITVAAAQPSGNELKGFYYKDSGIEGMPRNQALCDKGSAVIGGGADCKAFRETLHNSCPTHWEEDKKPLCGILKSHELFTPPGHTLGWFAMCEDGKGNLVEASKIWVICLRP